MFAEHFNHAAVRSQFCTVTVLGERFSDPELLRNLVNCIKFVGRVLIGREHPKAVHIPFHNVAQKVAIRNEFPDAKIIMLTVPRPGERKGPRPAPIPRSWLQSLLSSEVLSSSPLVLLQTLDADSPFAAS